MIQLLLSLALLAPQKFPPTPKAPQVARPEHVQVWVDSAAELNAHPGKIVGLRVQPNAKLNITGATAPRAIIIEGRGIEIRKLSFSPETSNLYVYDLVLVNEPDSYSPVDCSGQPTPVLWDDPMPNEDQPSNMAAFIDCYFGRGTPHWNVGHVEGVPGLVNGKVYAKWGINGKGPRHWYLSGCTFEAAQEHAMLYAHWPLSIYIENCISYADGGCQVQAVWRYGRPNDLDPRYYGNMSISPPPRTVPIVVRRSAFIDADIWGREGSNVTVAGGPADIFLQDLDFSGGRGAVAVWVDAFKGAYSRHRDGSTWVLVSDVDEMGDVLVGPGARLLENFSGELPGHPYSRVVLDGLKVAASENHSKVQIMVSGAREIVARNLQVTSHKPRTAFGAEGGSPWPNGRVRLMGQWMELDWPKYWDGDRYQTATPETHSAWFATAEVPPLRR